MIVKHAVLDEFANVDEKSAGRPADILRDAERAVEVAGGIMIPEGPLTSRELVGMLKEAGA